MRRSLVAVCSFLLVVLLGVVIVGPASSAKKGKAKGDGHRSRGVVLAEDFAVSSLSEPPAFAAAGSRFRVSFTVGNEGSRGAPGKNRVRFFLDRNPANRAGRINAGITRAGSPVGLGEKSGTGNARIPAGTANGNYFLVACVRQHRHAKPRRAVLLDSKKNNCRASGQAVGVGLSNVGPPGSPGSSTETRIVRSTLPLGSPTVEGIAVSDRPGDDEKSTQRRELAKVGPISIVADCKTTSNGDNANPGTAFSSPGNHDEDGDEGKILVYTDQGTVTFNSLGASSRRNIPPGEGTSVAVDPNQLTAETTGGEGKHMAIAVSRDPQQASPENDWVFGYKVGSIYISHSNGTELVFHGYAGIDVLGANDQCVFGGTLKVVNLAG